MIRPCPFTDEIPQLDESAYVDQTALVQGKVKLGARSSIWPGTVVRGDVHRITIGDETNVQDLSCLHVLKDRFSLTLGNRISVGHSVTLQVSGSEVVLGQWQRILMAELDGPRPRSLRVQVMGIAA